MTGFTSRVDSITMLEILDYGPIDQPDIMFDFMGFRAPTRLIRRRCSTPSAWPPYGRRPSVSSQTVLACRLIASTRPSKSGWRQSVTKWRRAGSSREPWAACGSSSPGSPTDEERVVLEHITRMGEASGPDWPRHPSPLGGYRVILDGLPTYTVDIEMHGRGNNMRGLTYATVMRELNAIPAVMAAPAGLLSTLDLPMVTGPVRGGTWRACCPRRRSRTTEAPHYRRSMEVMRTASPFGAIATNPSRRGPRRVSAGSYVGSVGGNQQPWQFVVLRSSEVRDSSQPRPVNLGRDDRVLPVFDPEDRG